MESLRELCLKKFDTDIVSPKQLKILVTDWERGNIVGESFPYNIRSVWTNSANKVDKGLYKVPKDLLAAKKDKKTAKTAKTFTVKKAVKLVKTDSEETAPVEKIVEKFSHVDTFDFVPALDKYYVPWGNSGKIDKIVISKLFYPTYITGQSGNGKTTMVEQVCAKRKREFIRVNITVATDEDDLIGGFRLENGETVWKDGPVVEAMKRGAILLLDECDLASSKIMCLQPVLEGKPIFIKKTNVSVEPKHGFNIIATANTKGKGSDDGRFIGTGILNEAFLDRFSCTFFQEYANKTIEMKILMAACDRVGIAKPLDMLNRLTDWAEIIREAQENGSIEDTISTRRLVNVIEAFSIFGNENDAIKISVERFEDEIKSAFLDMYKKLLPDEDMVKSFGGTDDEETE